MAAYDNIQLNSDFTAEEYSSPIIPFSEQVDIPAGGAITTINGDGGAGAAGPVVSLSGGSTGFTFTAVGASITMTGAPTSNAELILATVILDLNTNTKQTLYTVPVGKSAIITKVVARSPSVDLSGGATALLTFGFDAGASDWNNTTALGTTTLTASNLFKTMSQEFGTGGGPSTIGATGQTFGAITDAAFGSAATIVIEVFGNLF